MGINSKEIGWSQTSNLLYQLQKKLAGKNGDVSQEIGWRTEDSLLYDTLLEAPCSPCIPPTTTTTTTVVP